MKVEAMNATLHPISLWTLQQPSKLKVERMFLKISAKRQCYKNAGANEALFHPLAYNIVVVYWKFELII